MKNISKKLIAVLTALIMVFASAVPAFAGVEQDVEAAYNECAELYPEFVEKLKAQDVTDEEILFFLETLQKYLLGLDEEVTEENFEAHMIDAVNYAITLWQNINVRDGLVAAFPEAVVDGMDGIVNEEFVPILETVKRILFGKDEPEEETTLPEEETTEPATDAPTEPETEPATDAPTEPETEPATEPATDATTEPEEEKTEAPDEKPESGNGGTSGGTSGGTGGGATGGTSGGTGGTSDEDEGDDTTVEVVTPTEPVQKPTAPKVTFTDMNQAAWAEEAVNALVNMGIISGYPDGTFLPNKSITRAEFAKIIVLASGRYDKNAKCAFTDVKETDWFYSYVASAKQLGFINGRSDTIFDPNSNITRADLCTIVYRYIKTINSEFKATSTVTFADNSQIPSYAAEAVNALCSNAIANGMGDNKFEPLTPATRAQSAKIIHGAIKAALGM